MAVPTIAATATTNETSYNSSNWAMSLTGLGTPSAGDLLLAVVGFAVGSARNYSAPSGWTRLNYAFNSTDREIYIIAKASEGGETSATWAKGGASAGGAACLYLITGWYGTVANGVEASVISTSTGNPPSLAPSWGTSELHLWLAATVNVSSATVTSYPANYTESQLTVTHPNATRTTAAARIDAGETSSEDPGVYVLSSASSGLLTTIGVRPSAGASAVAGISRHYARMMTG